MKQFKLLCCGSRDIKDKEFIFKTLDFLLSNKDLNTVTIIHGAQKSFDKFTDTYFGADYLCDLWAKERGVKAEEFPADWDKYKRAAGPIRNKLMSEQSLDACVGFLGKSSRNIGSNGMLKLCENKGILIKKYYI